MGSFGVCARRGWAAVLFATVLGAGGATQSAVGATPAPACVITPVVRDVMINQSGIPSTGVSPLRLVRGKETLVRVFLSAPANLPSCAGRGAAIQLTGGTLSVSPTTTAGTGVKTIPELPAPPSTFAYPPITYPYPTTPAVNSAGDPIFAIPGSALAPSGTSFTATINLSMTYQSKGTSTGTVAQGPSPITTSRTFTVEGKSNAFRVLAVPMGLPSRSFAANFPATANTAMQNGFSGLSRTFAVPSGFGDLQTDTGGLRYTLSQNSLIDVSNFLQSGSFCGKTSNFGMLDTSTNAYSAGSVAGQLSGFLAAWNSANGPTPLNPNAVDHTADAALGVVDGAQSLGGASGCADGMAAFGGRVGWGRAISGSPSITPAVFSMEAAHWLGVVPSTRDDRTFNPSHSPQVTVDSLTGDLNRVYNVSARGQKADNHSVMNYSGTWNGDNTVLERDDYEYIHCSFGGTATNECKTAVPNPLGTPTGVAAGPTLYLAGTTDNTQAGTHLFESHSAPSVVRSSAPTNSNYFVRQLPSGQTNRVSVSFDDSVHGGNPLALFLNPFGVIYGAVPFNTDTTAIELWKGTPDGTNSTRIHFTNKPAVAPQISTPTTAQAGGNSIAAGGSKSVSDTITTPGIPPKPDVIFLADTTSSMDTALDDVKTHIGSIITTVKSAQPDAQFAAAHYKDLNCTGDIGYVLDRSMTANNEALASAIAANPDNSNQGWKATGGCDWPEDQLNALYQIANNPTSVGWRTASTRILVWFGDAVGHDPSPLIGGKTLAEVKAALASANIKVIAVPVVTSTTQPGLNYSSDDAVPGQATQITSATGGTLMSSTAPDDVAAAIQEGLQNLPSTVTTSQLTCGTGLSASLSTAPANGTVTSGGNVTVNQTYTATGNVTPGSSPSCSFHVLINGVDTQTISHSFLVADYIGQQVVTVSGTSTSPDATVDYYVTNCPQGPTIHWPVAIGQPLVDGTSSVRFDPTTCPGGTVEAALSDGVVQTGLVQASTPIGAGSAAPAVVAIDGPETGLVRQFGAVSLSGTSYPNAALQWSEDGSSANIPPGGKADFSPPEGGWLATHTYHFTLTAGGTVSAEVTRTGAIDFDNDGMTATFEHAQPALTTTGKPCFTQEPDPDGDPTNAYEDPDGDGILNVDDREPCVAAASYKATALFAPSEFKLSAPGRTVALNAVQVGNRLMADIDPGSVRLVLIANNDVSGDSRFINVGWVVNKSIGAALFNAPNLASYLNGKDLAGHRVWVRLVGQSKSGISPAWSFTGDSYFKVTP